MFTRKLFKPIAVGGLFLSATGAAAYSYSKNNNSQHLKVVHAHEEEKTVVKRPLPQVHVPYVKPLLCEDAVLTFAPDVPPPITRKEPAIIRVNMTTDSAVMPLSKMHKFNFWRFNKHTPGPFIRARVGDVLDLTITNEDETQMPHNVDFHAVSGPGGGATVTLVVCSSFPLIYTFLN